ncbi:MAG: protein-glutamate O-methyltransferase CheR [Chloroflexi bacterium]|nr:protein-glutamate O-methyltransferase CheR [Chloroflexota bacterium]
MEDSLGSLHVLGCLAMNNQEFDYLKKKVLSLAGIDLDSYKGQQMRRRLDGYVANQAEHPLAYCNTLERDREALQKLQQFLTINVSEFLRDKEQFVFLRNSVLPGLLRKRQALNIWSAGCSHGEEPYSLAILLEELAPGRNHKVLATDLNETVLASARQGGPYASTQLKNVDRSLLLKYFVKADDCYLVTARIREMVRFAQQNLLRDPFETDLDLILCRNVVIYFTDEAKTQLMRRFCRSLREDGVLFLGGCESLMASSSGDFTRLNGSIYRKRSSNAA